MALSESTLAAEMEAALDSLTAPSAPSAPQAIAEAFGTYFEDATHNAVSVLSAPIASTAVPAMAAAMVFSVPGTPASGAATLLLGYTAFWAALVAAPATYWPAAGVITPATGLASLSAALVAVFAVNNNPSITKAQAAANIAEVLHTSAGLTGTALIGVGPAAAPIL